MVLKTTDGGASWQILLDRTGPSFNALNSVHFTDLNTGYAVGSYIPGYSVLAPLILKTTDQGLNWGFQNHPANAAALVSVDFINKDTGFAAGLFGTILKTTDGGGEIISGIGSYTALTPTEFSLNQNYPNPFNPVTSIRYSVPARQSVSLKIYNSLGSEVALLVNEVQNAGSYEYKWDAGSFPSGIYFYRLQGENYTNTKKMILLK